MTETPRPSVEKIGTQLLSEVGTLLANLNDTQLEKFHLLNPAESQTLLEYIHELGDMEQSLKDQSGKYNNYTNSEIQRAINVCNIFLTELNQN